MAITPPCGKNVQQRPLVMGAKATGAFSSRAQILRSLDGREVAWMLSWRPARNACHYSQVSALRGLLHPSLPVICHCSEVQAFRREAHRPQGAHVDITVIHDRFELGVTTKKQHQVWTDGYPPPASSPAGHTPSALACAPVKPYHLQTGKQGPLKAPRVLRCQRGYQHLC